MCAQYICLKEYPWVSDAAVHMGLGRKVHHIVRVIAGKYVLHCGGVPYVGLYKTYILTFQLHGDVHKIARICETVSHHNAYLPGRVYVKQIFYKN